MAATSVNMALRSAPGREQMLAAMGADLVIGPAKSRQVFRSSATLPTAVWVMVAGRIVRVRQHFNLRRDELRLTQTARSAGG